MLQRPELRPILSALGWSDSQRRRGSDDAVVTSIRDFLATHLHSDGTRFSEQQAAFNVLVQAAAGPLVKSERHIAAAAEALGVRYATFRELLDVRAKMDAEAAHEVKLAARCCWSRARSGAMRPTTRRPCSRSGREYDLACGQV